LSEIASDAKADRRVQLNKLQSEVKLEAEKLVGSIQEPGSTPSA